jgi:putative endonuclease
MKILARHYRCPVGEADIVALERGQAGQTLVFVEVKTRRGRKYTDPESAVNADKQRRLRGIAKYSLSMHETSHRAVRFDVIAIVIPLGGKPDIRHITGAFG